MPEAHAVTAGQSVVVEHTGLLSEHTTEIRALKESDEKQWVILDEIRKRPPVWVTFAFTGLGGVIGSLSTALYFVINYYKR